MYRGRPLAYLDNASTTQKPQVVIDAITDVYKNHYANIHRGVYDLSQEATELYEGVRTKVAKFVGAGGDFGVVFTKNTTESLNLLAYCQGESLTSGDEILLSEMEHHSNIVPWQMVAARASAKGPFDSTQGKQVKSEKSERIKIKYLPIDGEGRLKMDLLPKFISKKTKIVSITLMSNVLGTINDVHRISSIVHRLAPKAIIIVDAAQAAGHLKMNVEKLGADFVVFSAHKMYGPTGVGVLVGKKKLLDTMPPFMGGGDMILLVGFDKTTFNEVPWKFEAGTPNIADVIAFGAAIDFIESIGLEKIGKHEMELTKYALQRLKEIPEVKIYGCSFENKEPPRGIKPQGSTLFSKRGPVIAFNVNGVHPHDVASILNEEAVAIRSGHHCAQPLMGVLGEVAVCRASFGIYNTKEEVDRSIRGIEKVKEVFRLRTKTQRQTQNADRFEIT